MDDLARLGVDRRVVVDSLELGQHLERTPRQLGPEQERLVRGDQRVAAEDGHEPRHAGGGQPGDPVIPAAHPQRREVGHRAGERVVERIPAGGQLRHLQLPGGERVGDPGPFLAEPAGADRPRDLPALARVGDDVRRHLPARARLELDAVAHRPAVHLTRLGERDLGSRVLLRIVEHQLCVVRVEDGRRRLGERSRVRRVTEREVVLLDREDVGEVAGDLDRELERHRLRRDVLDHDPLLHRVRHEALADDRDRVLRQTVDRRVPQVERRREVVDLARREQQRRHTVDGQPEAGEEARVAGEQPAGPLVDVPALVADAERRALENGQGHARRGYWSRRMRPPLDWASALTTISSTFTCSGRVSAKRTQSAMSSDMSGSTPW